MFYKYIESLIILAVVHVNVRPKVAKITKYWKCSGFVDKFGFRQDLSF